MEENTSQEFFTRNRSFSAIATAVPVFIGYTGSARRRRKDDLRLQPVAIDSMLQYERYFGKAYPENGISVEVLNGQITVSSAQFVSPLYKMNYAMQAYFANGGERCYIVSVGGYARSGVVELADFQAGLQAIQTVQDITLMVIPDAKSLRSGKDYYTLYNEVLQHCKEAGNRFVILDVWGTSDKHFSTITTLRTELTNDVMLLKNGAAYYPDLEMNIPCYYVDSAVQVKLEGVTMSLSRLRLKHPALYLPIKNALQTHLKISLPASPAVAGIYATVDRTHGVWKAPANVAVALAIKPVITITDRDQTALNVDPNTGKSVNAIRVFPGKGILVWGARTLAGNDNEWRYVSVRRFCGWLEASVQLITQALVFEPNDANTWLQVKKEVSNLLLEQWRNGALQGSKPEQAFFVKVGLGDTMTFNDVTANKMIVEIGLAVVRPAEFIVLRIVQQMSIP